MERYVIDVDMVVKVSDIAVEIDPDAPGTFTEKLEAAAAKVDIRAGNFNHSHLDHYVSDQNVTEVTNWNQID